MRAFLAIPIPEKTQLALAHLAKASLNESFRLVRPEQIHLTLAFFASMERREGERLREALGQLVSSWSPFALELGSWGVFPNQNSPKVVWVGVDAGRREVEQLAASLTPVLRSLGLPVDERPFRAHITLARRSQAPFSSLNLPSKILGDRVVVQSIELIQSQLTPHGPRYSRVWEVPLGFDSGERV